MPRRGQICHDHTIPYGTFNEDNEEARHAYYNYGYRRDEDLPELPCMPMELAQDICPEEELFKKEMAFLVCDALNNLSPRYSKVLRMRFGIDVGADYTLDEVGAVFELSKERIRQIQKKGMRLLKAPKRGLQDVANPEDYKTLAQREREMKEGRRKFEAEMQIQDRYRLAALHMPAKKKELWEELKPALKDAAWLSDVRVSNPETYQELKDLVAYLWDGSAPRVWNTFTRKEHHV